MKAKYWVPIAIVAMTIKNAREKDELVGLS